MNVFFLIQSKQHYLIIETPRHTPPPQEPFTISHSNDKVNHGPMSTNAASTVFAIPELAEQIIIYLPTYSTIHALRITRSVNEAILGSEKLRKRLFLEPLPAHHIARLTPGQDTFTKRVVAYIATGNAEHKLNVVLSPIFTAFAWSDHTRQSC